MTREEVFDRVIVTLVEAFNIDEDDIKYNSRLQGDLGAQSLDFLDIVFRLEREFAVKIPRGEIFPETIFHGDPECIQNDLVTQHGLCKLRERLPFADFTEFEKDPHHHNINDLFTVDMICKYIEHKLGVTH